MVSRIRIEVRRLPVALAGVVVIVALSACGGGGPPGQPAQLPSIVVTEPAQDLDVKLFPGESVEIRFTDNDPGGGGVIDVVADRDGLPETTADQVVIASDVEPTNGAQHVVSWLVSAVVPGDYDLLVFMRLGEDRRVMGQAPGRVHVNGFPDFSMDLPPTSMGISRGGLLCYGYQVADRDDVPVVHLTLDADGDSLTTEDAHELPLPPNAPGCTAMTTPTVPFGSYHLVGVADDGVNGPLVKSAPTVVEVSDVSWAKSLGDTRIFDMIVSADGSSICTGTFTGTVTLGSGEANATTLTSTGGDDIFVARFRPDGTLSWALAFGGPNDDRGNALAQEPDGGFVLVGWFKDHMTVGTGTKTTEVMAVAGGVDRFAARFTSTGGLMWVRRQGDSRADFAGSVAAFPDGSLVVSSSALDANAGNVDARTSRLERFDAEGVLKWSRSLTGTGVSNTFFKVAGHEDGEVLVAGSWDGVIVLGSGEPNETTLTSAVGSTGHQWFIARYAADGDLLWVRRITSTGEIGVDDLATFGDGTFVASGRFEKVGTWGHGESGQAVRTSAGAHDAYVARYNASGVLVWLHITGSPVAPPGGPALSGEDGYPAVSALADGSCVVCGTVYGPTTIESTGGPRTLPLGYGGQTALCVRYGADGTEIWHRTDRGDPFQVNAFVLGTAEDGSCVRMGSIFGTFTFGALDATPATITVSGAVQVGFITRFNADGGY